MKSAFTAIVLIGASLLCLYGFASVVFSKGVRVSAAVDNTVAVAVLVGSALLPVAGFLSLRAQRSSPDGRKLLFPVFLISLVPAVIVLCAVLVVLLVRPPA